MPQENHSAPGLCNSGLKRLTLINRRWHLDIYPDALILYCKLHIIRIVLVVGNNNKCFELVENLLFLGVILGG